MLIFKNFYSLQAVEALPAENKTNTKVGNHLQTSSNKKMNNYQAGKSLYSIILALKDVFEDAIKTAFPDLPDVPVVVAASDNPKFGDYQCNSAMPITKLLKGQGILFHW